MNKFEVLKEYFGHDGFRNGQSEIIDSILSGRDVLGIMPTGAGKSICYQVPAMILEGITLVVSPLISLMKDQVSSLLQAGISAAYINSSLSAVQYRSVFNKAYNGAYKIIYVAPERLSTEEFINFAEKMKISMLTVDEAHCVSQWGQDFRPSYLKIVEFIERLSYRPIVSAFTATATNEVKNDISLILRLKSPFEITTGFDRSNLFFSVIKPQNKYYKLREIVSDFNGKCGIIYCLSRKNVEDVCEKLCNDGFSATRYHAGLSEKERRENQDDFIYDRKLIIVATNAFGMGIDKSNVSFVIHYNMPKNLESYYQEAGRAGRDGGQADCILLYNPIDVRTNNFMIENNRDSNENLDSDAINSIIAKDKERLKAMTIYCTTNNCLREFILRYFGEASPNYCGNCSNCISEFETVDVTIDAQKIVSCVYRIHQKGCDYGKKMITDVLHGSKNEKIIKLEFNKLSTYGIMSDTPTNRIRSILDFLIENNYLMLSDGEYNTVRLSSRSAEIIRDRKTIQMKLPKNVEPDNKRNNENIFYADNKLFKKLKELRNSIASDEHVPAYIVFADSALKDMCRKLPSNRKEFLNISGVGNAKADKYSDLFCNLIIEYQKENPDDPKAPDGEVSYLEKQLASYREQVVSKKSSGAISLKSRK